MSTPVWTTAERWRMAVVQARRNDPAAQPAQAVARNDQSADHPPELLAGAQVGPGVGQARRSRWVRTLGVLGAVAAVVVLIGGGWWWGTGGRWMLVASASMGRAAPVGTMVFTRPVTTGELRVGDIVSFRSPINPGEIYTHRVIQIDPAGGVHTKGDINGAADPAALHTGDLIGKVVTRGWAAGWLIRALPILIIGAAGLWAVTRRWATLRWRGPLRVFGSSVLFALAALWLQPFVGFVVLARMPTTTGTDLTLVSTGILPIRLNATGGAHLDLVDGQLGTVGTAGPPGPHGYALTSTLHLDLWWWITVILIWFTPLLAALLTGPPAPAAPQPPGADHPDDEHPTGDHPGPGPESSGRQTLDEPAVPTGHDARRPPRSAAGGSGRAPRRRPWLLLLGAVAAVLIAAALAPSTAAAFTAKISNTADTVGTAPYFTCAAAATAYSPFFSYPLADAATASANTAADVSGNTRTGTYGTNIAPSASNPCSNRDTTGSILLSGTGTTTLVQTPTQVTNPTVFTETIRFKTVTGGGKLIGFGNLATGTSSNYDRHLYLTNTGQVVFGVYNNAVFTAISPATYLDGNWHQATATLSTAGMILYLDGTQVATNPNTAAQNYTGYWRIGYDNLSGWGTTQPTNFYFTGNLAYAATYTTALTPTQIKNLYAAGS